MSVRSKSFRKSVLSPIVYSCQKIGRCIQCSTYPCQNLGVNLHGVVVKMRPWGSTYAVAAHPEPASPCHTTPCIPSPRGLYPTPHPLFPYPCGPTCPRYPYPTRTDHCRDWVICVPRYRVSHTLGSGSITPSVAYLVYWGDPLGRIDLYWRLPVVDPR